MRLNQNITLRKANVVMKHNGYKLVSCRGSHYKYKNDAGNVIVLTKTLNGAVWGRLIRENNLKI